jgi:hypothetical protein
MISEPPPPPPPGSDLPVISRQIHADSPEGSPPIAAMRAQKQFNLGGGLPPPRPNLALR